MVSSFLILGLVILVLILLSGFFSGSETALTATSRARMYQLAKENDKRAKWVNSLLEQHERLLSAILLGNNLVNIMASALATSLFLKLFGDTGVLYATLVMTCIVVIFAEVLPKTYAILNPDNTSLRVAGVMRFIVWVFAPFTLGLNFIARGIMRLLGFNADDAGNILPAHEEIRGAIDMHHSTDAVTKGDRDMLGGILDLKDLTLEDVMVHRKGMMMINISLKTEEIVRQVLDSPHTRIPFWENEIENIIGILHAKDLLRALAASPEGARDLEIRSLISPPWFVPETTSLAEQLNAFRARKAHFALVVDEYGGLMGLVTLEDILEEIVGQIDDEHDNKEKILIPAADGSLLIDGSMTVRDLNRETGWDLPENEAITIAGLVIHEARAIPKPGQVFVYYGFRIRIISRHRNQITQLEIKSDKTHSYET